MTAKLGGGADMLLQLLHQCDKKSDTDKFVALSILQNVLDANDSIRTNAPAVLAIWRALPHTFVHRLLRSRPSSRVNADTSTGMNQLAVAVVHAFINMIPTADLDDAQAAHYVVELLDLITVLPQPHRALAFHALQCLTSTSTGAQALLTDARSSTQLSTALETDADDLEPVVRVLRASLLNGSLIQEQRLSWDGLVTSIIDAHPKSPAALIDLLSEMLTSDIDSQLMSRSWTLPGVRLVQRSMLQSSSPVLRTSSVIYLGHVLQHSHVIPNAAAEIFGSSETHGTTSFAQLLVGLLLADIRASIPSLMATLADPSYSKVAMRLAMSFELLTSFLALLMRTLDDENNENADVQLDLDPDRILRLRNDVSEALILTVEYFRDRWDASFAGAAGLHESARAHTSSTSSMPLQLPWDNLALPPAKDPLILAGLRCLALWLCEDDSDVVQQQVVGILDMLLALHEGSTDMENTDVRQVVLTILAGLLPASPEAVKTLLDHDGWNILSGELTRSLTPSNHEPHVEDALMVLNMVVGSEHVSSSREAWMQVVSGVAGFGASSADGQESWDANVQIAAYRLVLSIYSKAPPRLQKMHKSNLTVVLQQAKGLRSHKGSRQLNAFFADDLDEIVEEMEHYTD